VVVKKIKKFHYIVSLILFCSPTHHFKEAFNAFYLDKISICGIEFLPSNIGAMNIIKEVGKVSYYLKLRNHSPHYVAIAHCHPNLNSSLKTTMRYFYYQISHFGFYWVQSNNIDCHKLENNGTYF
jgi:hypothetical protein